VEILPGTDGLLHISELDNQRVNRVEDVVNLGDRVTVKVISIDQDGKVRLSRRALLPKRPGSDRDRDRDKDRDRNRKPARPRRS